jgi:hypothetical protein
MNRTPNGPGIGTLARAKYQREQRAADARDARLREARAEQIELARTFVFHPQGQPVLRVDELDEADPRRVVFEATLDAFSTALADRPKDGKRKKGAIAVAAEAAAEAHAELFVSDETADAALVGSDWAVKALSWAGNRLFKQPAAKPANQDAAAPADKPAKAEPVADELGAKMRAAGIRPARTKRAAARAS